MADRMTPLDFDNRYTQLLAAIRAEAAAGMLAPERAVTAIQSVEAWWRRGRYQAVQEGLTELAEQFKLDGDPRMAGVIRMIETFRDDPKEPMLRRSCDCGGRLIKREMVDPPEDSSPPVEWRCVTCGTLYDATGMPRGRDPRRQ